MSGRNPRHLETPIRLHQAAKCSGELTKAQPPRPPSPAAHSPWMPLPCPQCKRGHSFPPACLWEALLGWSVSSPPSWTFPQGSCRHLCDPRSSQCQLGPAARLSGQSSFPLLHSVLSLTHLLRHVPSDSPYPPLAPPLCSPFLLPPFQESLQPPRCFFRSISSLPKLLQKEQGEKMYPWEVTDSLGDLSL